MSLNCTETHTDRHINTHANMQTNTTGSSVLICSSLHVHLHFHHHLLPPLFLNPSLSSSVKRRGWKEGGSGWGKEVCVCACVAGAFENSSGIAVVLWWSREWYREIMKRWTKALSSWCDWYPAQLLPSSQPLALPPTISLFFSHFPSVYPHL